jgi:hypothetical protein
MRRRRSGLQGAVVGMLFAAIGSTRVTPIAHAQSKTGSIGTKLPTPPAGDPYNRRLNIPTAFQWIKTADPEFMTGDPEFSPTYYRVGTNVAGDTVYLQAQNPSGGAPFDYYTTNPWRESDGTIDPSYNEFDWRDQWGHFSGYNYFFGWSDGTYSYQYVERRVNGATHWFSYQADSAGNVSNFQEAKAEWSKPRDPCNVISDWGALQCPADLSTVKPIPTEVRGRVMQIGFWSWLDKETDAAANKFAQAWQWLHDPQVQVVLLGIVTTAAIIGCGATTVGVGLAACLTVAFGGFALGLGSIQMPCNPSVSACISASPQAGQLRASGGIACTGSECYDPMPVTADPAAPAGRIICLNYLATDGFLHYGCFVFPGSPTPLTPPPTWSWRL